MSRKPVLPRYVCIHGHFYQPPRENPWLGAVEREEGAAPYPDWNERITAECYAPNARSRILDDRGKVARISNNYEKISFNFGPTLLSWIAEKAPAVFRGLKTADERSRTLRGGHGNALAQPYTHVILPLTETRDRLTQIRWGIAAFRHAWGRSPEGMWLPETAVDVKTLETLAQEGVEFTILAPHQARRFRPVGKREWQEFKEGVNPRRAYWCPLPSGKKIALFFYDGALSHGIAFQNTLSDGEGFARRLLEAFDPLDPTPQLAHVATDGESYGHHRLFGDMALAYALSRLENDSRVRLTNYGQFLELFPPQFEVEIQENTSWSCAHGIGRWQEDCGCRAGGGEQHQRWRGPLREGLNRVKKELDTLFEEQGAIGLKDPWQARDAYVEVLLNRSADNTNRFFREQARQERLSPEDRVRAWKLLEMQHNSLLMFTSCGWFFDEISGLETRQILKYACRAIQLARDFGRDLEPLLLSHLSQAPSNLEEYRDGRGVWEQLIRPSAVDLNQVLAHQAIASLYRDPEERSAVYCYDLKSPDREVQRQNGTQLAVGRLQVHSRLTGEEQEMIYAVLHFGGLDFYCRLKAYHTPKDYETFKSGLQELYQTASVGEVYDRIREFCGGRHYYLKDLFLAERRHLIDLILNGRLEEYYQQMGEWVRADEGVMKRLVDWEVPLPPPMGWALRLFLKKAWDQAMEEGPADSRQWEALSRLVERMKKLEFPIDKNQMAETIQGKAALWMKDLLGAPDPSPIFIRVKDLLAGAGKLDLPVNRWSVQNSFLDACLLVSDLSPQGLNEYRTFAEELELPVSVVPGGAAIK